MTPAIESATNAAIGMLVSMAITHFCLGFPAMQSAGITAVFFVASFARAWIIREAFKKWEI